MYSFLPEKLKDERNPAFLPWKTCEIQTKIFLLVKKEKPFSALFSS
jgi:hypothetical protein